MTTAAAQSPSGALVLVVEDERALRETLAANLRARASAPPKPRTAPPRCASPPRLTRTPWCSTWACRTSTAWT
jgi:hypothetical protein